MRTIAVVWAESSSLALTLFSELSLETAITILDDADFEEWENLDNLLTPSRFD
jgi:hypothetical protein